MNNALRDVYIQVTTMRDRLFSQGADSDLQMSRVWPDVPRISSVSDNCTFQV